MSTQHAMYKRIERTLTDLNALNASSELEATAATGNIAEEGEDDGFCIVGDARTIGDCGKGLAGEPPRACASLDTPPRVLPEPAKRLGGRIAGHGRPFLLTHTIRCMPTQNSTRESLLSPSASASCQICRNCCNKVANEGAKATRIRSTVRLNHSLRRLYVTYIRKLGRWSRGLHLRSFPKKICQNLAGCDSSEPGIQLPTA